MKRLSIMVLIAMLGIALITPPNTVYAGFNSNPDQDSGWTKARSISGGCDNAGNCGGSSRAEKDLYEYTPHRSRNYARDEGPRSKSGHPVYVVRQICTYYGIELGYSAGSWHHGAKWTKEEIINRQIWDGPKNPHWAFWHDDSCRPLVTPTPIASPLPTYTPIPEYTPTTVPTNIAETLINIDVNVQVQGTPPSGGDADGEGGGDYPVGGVVTASADYPSSWDRHPTWGGIRYSGCNTTGSRWQARFYAPGNDCTITFTIVFQDAIPTGTPAPTPTEVIRQCEHHERPFPLWIPQHLDKESNAEPLSGSPTFTFLMDTLVRTKDIEERGEPHKWNKAEVKVEYWNPAAEVWQDASRMTWHVVGHNFRANQDHVWGADLPVPRGYHTRDYNDQVVATTWRVHGLKAGQHRLVTKTSNQNCSSRAEFFFFRSTGSIPPPPGPSQATLYAWVYNQQEEAYQSTRDNPNPARWRWGYGGPMEFYPDLELDFTLDPALAAQGYRVESEITGWTFRGSPDLGPTEEDLGYEESVTASWTVVEVPEKDGEYRYVMDRTDAGPQPLDVAVHYTYQMVDATGVAVGEPVEDTLTGTFTIGIVMSQIVRDHMPENVDVGEDTP